MDTIECTCKKSGTLFSLYISASILVFLFSLMSYLLKGDLNSMLWGFTLFYLTTVFYSIYLSGVFSIYSIYLYTSAFFIYDAFFLTLIDPDINFLKQTFPLPFSFSEKTGFIFIVSSFLTVFFTHIGYVYFYQRGKNKRFKYSQEELHNPLWEQISIVLLLISSVPVTYKILLQLRYVMAHGYAVMYSDGFDKLKYPFWCSGAYLFFNGSYYLFIASRPKKKNFLIFTVLFVFVYFFNSLKGGRGTLISTLLVVLFYYQEMYAKEKITFKKLIPLGLLVIFLTFFLGNLRSSYGGGESKSYDSIMDVLKYVLWSQTNTKGVPMLIMDREIKYRRFPFIWYPFLNIFLKQMYHFKDNEMGAILVYNNPSQVLMANISVNMVLDGRGYGTAFLGEAYDLAGYAGVIILSFLLGMLLVFYDTRKMNIKSIWVPIAFAYLYYIPFLPRYAILHIFGKTNHLLMCYFYILLISFFLVYLKKKESPIEKYNKAYNH